MACSLFYEKEWKIFSHLSSNFAIAMSLSASSCRKMLLYLKMEITSVAMASLKSVLYVIPCCPPKYFAIVYTITYIEICSVIQQDTDPVQSQTYLANCTIICFRQIEILIHQQSRPISLARSRACCLSRPY
jgi:hypothetical protein